MAAATPFFEFKMKRQEFLNLIQPHFNPNTTDLDELESSKTFFINIIRDIYTFRNEEQKVNTNSLSLSNLRKFLAEIVDIDLFDFDYDPQIIPDEQCYSATAAPCFHTSKSGTRRPLLATFKYPTLPALARDSGIGVPFFDEKTDLIDVLNLGITNEKISTAIIEPQPLFSDCQLNLLIKIAFYTLPIRFSVEELREMFPTHDFVHPECRYYDYY